MSSSGKIPSQAVGIGKTLSAYQSIVESMELWKLVSVVTAFLLLGVIFIVGAVFLCKDRYRKLSRSSPSRTPLRRKLNQQDSHFVIPDFKVVALQPPISRKIILEEEILAHQPTGRRTMDSYEPKTPGAMLSSALKKFLYSEQYR